MPVINLGFRAGVHGGDHRHIWTSGRLAELLSPPSFPLRPGNSLDLQGFSARPPFRGAERNSLRRTRQPLGTAGSCATYTPVGPDLAPDLLDRYLKAAPRNRSERHFGAI